MGMAVEGDGGSSTAGISIADSGWLSGPGEANGVGCASSRPSADNPWLRCQARRNASLYASGVHSLSANCTLLTASKPPVRK